MTLITRRPQTETGIMFKELICYINSIKTKYEANVWKLWFERLEIRYTDFLKERTYIKTEEGKIKWWYTHKNVKTAFRTIKSSLDNLFHYINYDGLEKDTNGLEYEFSHLKQKSNLHRGLKINRRIALTYWYLHFVNQRRRLK